MIAYFNFAGIYSTTNNLDLAFLYYQKVHTQSLALYMTVMGLTGMAEVYLLRKQFEESKAYYDRAMAQAEPMNSPPTKSRLLTDLGNWYLQTGNPVEAMHYQEMALEIRKQYNINASAITNMSAIADIYLHENKISDAITMLEKALSLADSIHIKPKIFPIHQKLAVIYESLGDKDKYIYHFRKFHDISLEVNKEDAQTKVKNIQMIMEAEQTRKENAVIKAQKIIIEQNNIKLQKTIDELTLTKISRKAKAITFTIAICLFIIEDSILHYVISPLTHHSALISLCANGAVVFSIKPIEKVVEHYLLKRFVHLNKEYTVNEALEGL